MKLVLQLKVEDREGEVESKEKVKMEPDVNIKEVAN